MPIDSVGIDKMSILDIDPKTYSPMSCSDENLSSPPSVLTTASAGSCTPSSLPSAGSTPSSIQSAGSTPYQFISQEESTIIKPFTPSDNHSVHSFTPDQPVTPDPSVIELPTTEIPDKNICIRRNLESPLTPSEPVDSLVHLHPPNSIESVEISPERNQISFDRARFSPEIAGSPNFVHRPEFLPEINERRNDCPCVMCDTKFNSNEKCNNINNNDKKSNVNNIKINSTCEDISNSFKKTIVIENPDISLEKNNFTSEKVELSKKLSELGTNVTVEISPICPEKPTDFSKKDKISPKIIEKTAVQSTSGEKIIKIKPDKPKRKSRRKPLYKSELSDPLSNCIKLKIKLTSIPYHKPKKLKPSVNKRIKNSHVHKKNVDKSYEPYSEKVPYDKKGVKRKSKKNAPSKKRKKFCPVPDFIEWGMIEDTVNNEPHSPWACKMPKEILENIFLYATMSEGSIPLLLRLSKVCRLWREVSVGPRLWTSIDLATGLIRPKHRNERMLLWIIENRLTNVKDINLSGWTEAVTPLMLRRISEKCAKLESISLGNCSKLHSENLQLLLCSSPKIVSLDLTGVMGNFKPTPRSAVGLQTIADLCSMLKNSLKNFILSNNTMSNLPATVNTIADHCVNLEVLDLSCIETVNRDLVRIDIEKLQKGCCKIRVLRLANSLIRLTQNSLADQASSPGFPNLEELSMAVNDRAGDLGMCGSELERILKNSHKLCLLDIRRCQNIADSALIRIAPWDLVHLFLSGGTAPKLYSDRLELVIRKWQHSLVELDLSWTCSYEAIDAAILALSEEKNEKLEVLNLCGSAVNFTPIEKVLKNCPKLRWLNLSSCRALPRGVKRLYEDGTSVEKLRSAVLEGKFAEKVESDE